MAERVMARLRDDVTGWVLVLVALVALGMMSTIDGRMMIMGHLAVFLVSVGMFWATLNLTKQRKAK